MLDVAAFEKIANGNQDAKSFCLALYNFVHLLDDYIDNDKPVHAKDAVFVSLAAFGAFATNPFFQAHRVTLLSAIHVASVAYVDSLNWEGSTDVVDQAASQFLKSAYQDVFYLVAYLCGGLEHQLAISKEFRGYDIDKPMAREVLATTDPKTTENSATALDDEMGTPKVPKPGEILKAIDAAEKSRTPCGSPARDVDPEPST